MRPERASVGRPAGAVVRAAELRVWHDAAAMLACAERRQAAMRDASVAAFEAERRRGYDEGMNRGAEEMAQRLTVLGAAAAAALDGIERALPGLVCDVVENLLGTFDVQALLRPAVRHALGRLRLGSAVTIRVAPAGVAEVQAACDAQSGGAQSGGAQSGGAQPGLHVAADPNLALGRCLVESELGTVEVGLEAQLAILRATMTTAWEQAA